VGTSRNPLLVAVIVLPVLMVGAGPSSAEHVYHLDDDDEVTAEAMAADALVVRPAGMVSTVLGSLFYAVSLPFSYFGGNQPQAYETLVQDPVQHTFRRPLGEDL